MSRMTAAVLPFQVFLLAEGVLSKVSVSGSGISNASKGVEPEWHLCIHDVHQRTKNRGNEDLRTPHP